MQQAAQPGRQSIDPSGFLKLPCCPKHLIDHRFGLGASRLQSQLAVGSKASWALDKANCLGATQHCKLISSGVR